jgi:hypothetical protein
MGCVVAGEHTVDKVAVVCVGGSGAATSSSRSGLAMTASFMWALHSGSPPAPLRAATPQKGGRQAAGGEADRAELQGAPAMLQRFIGFSYLSI